MPMTPGQKQMVAIRDLIRAEVAVFDAKFGPLAAQSVADYGAHVAFLALCEAFGHEVPTV